MAERRRKEIDVDREMGLIFNADVPPQVKSAMMNELTMEILEEARQIREETAQIEAENAARRRGELWREAPVADASKLRRELRRRAGLLPPIEAAEPELVSDPISAKSEAAALFSLIHDAGGRMPEGGDHG